MDIQSYGGSVDIQSYELPQGCEPRSSRRRRRPRAGTGVPWIPSTGARTYVMNNAATKATSCVESDAIMRGNRERLVCSWRSP